MELHLKIIGRRQEYEQDGEVNEVHYFLSDGVYGWLSCLIFDHYEFEPIAPEINMNEHKIKSIFWGPTCDSMDKLGENIMFPIVDIDTEIILYNMGSYTNASATNFNGIAQPLILVKD